MSIQVAAVRHCYVEMNKQWAEYRYSRITLIGFFPQDKWTALSSQDWVDLFMLEVSMMIEFQVNEGMTAEKQDR